MLFIVLLNPAESSMLFYSRPRPAWFMKDVRSPIGTTTTAKPVSTLEISGYEGNELLKLLKAIKDSEEGLKDWLYDNGLLVQPEISARNLRLL